MPAHDQMHTKATSSILWPPPGCAPDTAVHCVQSLHIFRPVFSLIADTNAGERCRPFLLIIKCWIHHNYSGTSLYGHLTSKVISPLRSPLPSHIEFHSAMNGTFALCNMVTSRLGSHLPSHMDEHNSEVLLYCEDIVSIYEF